VRGGGVSSRCRLAGTAPTSAFVAVALAPAVPDSEILIWRGGPILIFSSSACLGEGPLRQQVGDLGLQEGVGERDGVAGEGARLELGSGVPFSVPSAWHHAGNDLAAVSAINAEVRIGREDERVGEGLAHPDEAGIGKAHRDVRVLLHQT